MTDLPPINRDDKPTLTVEEAWSQFQELALAKADPVAISVAHERFYALFAAL